MEKDPPEFFHEKQSLQRCAIHTINNLFQREEIDVTEMDTIAKNLSPGSFFSPHKSMWGTGNYDVNVIMSALTVRGKVCRWWDRRKNLDYLTFGSTMGLVVNQNSRYLAGLWKSKHWYAITIIDSEFYDCNSHLSKPKKMSKEELLGLLKKEVAQGGEIIRVLNEDVEDEDFPLQNEKKERMKGQQKQK